MLELKEYNLLGSLQDEEDVLSEFDDYDSSTYVFDAITYIADGAIPIYYEELWKHAEDIQEYIEQAVEEGLVDTRKFDLIKCFQYGYYEYYTVSLYQNLDILVFNKIANKVNEYLNTLNEEVVEKIDLSSLEEEIEGISDNYDNNNKFSDIEYEIDRIIQAIKDGEFNEQ